MALKRHREVTARAEASRAASPSPSRAAPALPRPAPGTRCACADGRVMAAEPRRTTEPAPEPRGSRLCAVPCARRPKATRAADLLSEPVLDARSEVTLAEGGGGVARECAGAVQNPPAP